MGKRLLSMVFTVMLVVTSVDVTAFAQNTNNNVSETETVNSEVSDTVMLEEESQPYDGVAESGERSQEAISETVQGTEEETESTVTKPIQETEDESGLSETMSESEECTESAETETEVVATSEEVIMDDFVQVEL